MTTLKMTAASLVLAISACLLAPLAAAAACEPFTVPNSSFQKLSSGDEARNKALGNAYVWIDDIHSKLVGGWRPFEMYVVVGHIYPPFSRPNGKLQRDAFLRLMDPKDVNNEVIGPLTVQPPEQGLQISFKVGNLSYSVQVQQVNPVMIGNDTVDLLLCFE
jgi:hypothetical protein